ncbi:MAG TPA: type II toxin-antitoxin system VapC family toxin [Stellaceae bacterium]|jgi:ribonuclease VapC|nr:type II toxin-antitoxin system VapC family toxin [Stellaceae bacterium]
MFVDASAMVAILVEESDAAALTKRLEQAVERCTSPIALYEAVVGVARVCNVPIRAAEMILDRFLERATVRVVPITAEIGHGALTAFERYGRGRHPAALTMGDCFAYACARALDVPILFKGDDFPLTDITVA